MVQRDILLGFRLFAIVGWSMEVGGGCVWHFSYVMLDSFQVIENDNQQLKFLSFSSINLIFFIVL